MEEMGLLCAKSIHYSMIDSTILQWKETKNNNIDFFLCEEKGKIALYTCQLIQQSDFTALYFSL